MWGPESCNIATMKARTLILLGSNQGEPMEQLEVAKREIAATLGVICQQSQIYQTAAWGNTEQPDFLNQVVMLETDLAPGKLMQRLLALEQKMGRVRAAYMGPRVIDLDILLYEQAVINEPGLTIPHPRLPLRRFVLVPLAELIPDWIHPTEQKSIQQLLDNCTDTLNVNKFYPA